MSDYTEKSVSMKCKHCGYEEDVPQWVLDELNEFSDDKSYQMICRECEELCVSKNRQV